MDLVSTVEDALALRLLWTGLDRISEPSSEEPVVDPNSQSGEINAK